MMTTKKLIAFAACLFCAAHLFALTGLVLSVEGKVEIQRGDDEWLPLEEGDEIDVGDVISTGFKSEAVIALDETTITVKALTRLTLEQLFEQNGDKASTMYLESGSMNASVRSEEDKKVAFKVKTPAVTASVRGTDGIIYVNRVVGLSGKWLLTPPEPKLSRAQILAQHEAELEAIKADEEETAAEVERALAGGDESLTGDDEEAGEDESVDGDGASEGDELSEEAKSGDESASDADAMPGEAGGDGESPDAGAKGAGDATSDGVATGDAKSADDAGAADNIKSAGAGAEKTSTSAEPKKSAGIADYFSSLNQAGGVLVHAGETSTVSIENKGGFSLKTPQQTAASAAVSTVTTTSNAGAVVVPATTSQSSQEAVPAVVPETPVVEPTVEPVEEPVVPSVTGVDVGVQWKNGTGFSPTIKWE